MPKVTQTTRAQSDHKQTLQSVQAPVVQTRVVPTAHEREQAEALPLNHRFTLGARITGEQQAFLDAYGFLLFSQVVLPNEIERIFEEMHVIEDRWLSEGRTEVNGIPIWVGQDENKRKFIQRFPFTSTFSKYMHSFIRDPRFFPVRSLAGENTRVGDQEKDGLVFHRYINVIGSAYKQLGWHTDGLRDLFMIHPDWPIVRTPGPMLNFGMHFDEIRKEDGGLRLIPGSHDQGFISMLTRKPSFISNRPDKNELAIETRPGDLTLHDGRMWHRVERSPYVGRRSLRRTMYVPYLVDTRKVKDDNSATPFYHHLGTIAREARVTAEQKLDRIRTRLLR